MERIILVQLENLEILGEQNRLLKEQNDLLQKETKKLKDQFLEKVNLKPYIIPKEKTERSSGTSV